MRYPLVGGLAAVLMVLSALAGCDKTPETAAPANSGAVQRSAPGSDAATQTPGSNAQHTQRDMLAPSAPDTANTGPSSGQEAGK